MSTYTRLGRDIRAARNEKGWSQKTLAKLLGTSRQRIILWEQGKHCPRRSYQWLLTEFLVKSFDWSPDPDEIQKRAGEIYDRRVEEMAS